MVNFLKLNWFAIEGSVGCCCLERTVYNTFHTEKEKRTKFLSQKNHLSWGPRVLFGFLFFYFTNVGKFLQEKHISNRKKNKFYNEKKNTF
jgi:hypothetical protein